MWYSLFTRASFLTFSKAMFSDPVGTFFVTSLTFLCISPEIGRLSVTNTCSTLKIFWCFGLILIRWEFLQHSCKYSGISLHGFRPSKLASQLPNTLSVFKSRRQLHNNKRRCDVQYKPAISGAGDHESPDTSSAKLSLYNGFCNHIPFRPTYIIGTYFIGTCIIGTCIIGTYIIGTCIIGHNLLPRSVSTNTNSSIFNTTKSQINSCECYTSCRLGQALVHQRLQILCIYNSCSIGYTQ
jgi:hypothetical protein